MTDTERRKRHADYMREWSRRNLEKVRKTAARKRADPDYAHEQKLRAAAHYRENADEYKQRARERKLRLKYGLSPEAVEALRQVQNNRCRICGDSFENVKMHVDHDHATGRVRGLLCQFCNHGLGSFRDSIERLASAMHYLNQ